MSTNMDFFLPSEIRARFRIDSCIAEYKSATFLIVYDFEREHDCQLCVIESMESSTYAKIMTIYHTLKPEAPVCPIIDYGYYRNRKLFFYTYSTTDGFIQEKIFLPDLFSEIIFVQQWAAAHEITLPSSAESVIFLNNSKLCIKNWMFYFWCSDYSEPKSTPDSDTLLFSSLDFLYKLASSQSFEESVLQEILRIRDACNDKSSLESVKEKLGNISSRC